MTRPSQRGFRLTPLRVVALLVALHLVLREILIRVDLVSTILSAGAHTPIWMLFAAVTFAVVRLTVFLVIPSVVAWTMVLGIAAWIGAGRPGGTGPESVTDRRHAGNLSRRNS